MDPLLAEQLAALAQRNADDYERKKNENAERDTFIINVQPVFAKLQKFFHDKAVAGTLSVESRESGKPNAVVSCTIEITRDDNSDYVTILAVADNAEKAVNMRVNKSPGQLFNKDVKDLSDDNDVLFGQMWVICLDVLYKDVKPRR